MDLAAYFKNARGTGILATCDPENEVDLAVYSKPVAADNETLALVMKQRQSHRNLQKHLKACYMFLEADGQRGLRISLTMERQEKNRSLIDQLRKEQPCMFPEEDDSDKFLVFFRVDRIRPLVGEFDS